MTTRWCALDSLGLLAAGGGLPCRSKLTRTRRAFLCTSIGKVALASSVTRLTTDSRIGATCHITFGLAKVCEPAKFIDDGSQSLRGR